MRRAEAVQVSLREIKQKAKYHRDKIRRVLCEKKGMTLVELIVTFALITIFSVGTCSVMADSLKVYYKIRGLNNGQQVIDTLMDKVAGRIEGAHVDASDGGIGILNNGVWPTMVLSKDGSSIEFYDKDSSHIVIATAEETTQSGKTKKVVNILYKAVTGQSGNRYDEVNWKYDLNMYMGFEVKDLRFAIADQEKYDKNVIKIALTITSPEYGDFTSVRYVRCFNFISEMDRDKIYQMTE